MGRAWGEANSEAWLSALYTTACGCCREKLDQTRHPGFNSGANMPGQFLKNVEEKGGFVHKGEKIW